MATPYEKVYNRFLQKISDFNLAEVDDFFKNLEAYKDARY